MYYYLGTGLKSMLGCKLFSVICLFKIESLIRLFSIFWLCIDSSNITNYNSNYNINL